MGLVTIHKKSSLMFLLCFSEEEPSRYEVRPDPKDISFSDGGPKAWFVAVRKSAG